MFSGRPHRIVAALLCGLPAILTVSTHGEIAGNYSQSQGNWVSGTHRGSFDFGPWTLDKSSGSNSGHFIGDSTDGGSDINTDGKAFGLFGHGSGNYAGAARRFAKREWTTGDTFSCQLAVNFRNGSKGFNLRNGDGNNVFTFLTGNVGGVNGNFVNGSNVGLNPYHENTVFTFTFTQLPRHLAWRIDRSGGLTATATGMVAIASATVHDIRFFCANTDNGNPENNLYFNNLSFTPAVRNDAPLTLGERRYPGYAPSYMLRFQDDVAATVTLRSSNDGWSTSHPLTPVGDGVWEIDIRDAGIGPGWHTFKFRLNGSYEGGANRRMFVREDGQIVKPPAVWLTWMQDPTTTMTVRWMARAEDTGIRYRVQGDTTWISLDAEPVTTFPFSDRWIQHIELTGLNPATVYQFEVDGYIETYSFKTMPSTLNEPLRTMFTGDILYGGTANDMAVTMGALDPAFLVIGGDLSYSDGRAEQIWMEYFLFENWHTRFRAPDGRLIPLITAIGNHEVRRAYVSGYPYIENTDAWREREAPYFFRPYAFPGQPGYGVLDFGDYLSLILLDTDHVNPIEGAQTAWLALQLDARRHVRHLFPVYHVPAWPSVRNISDARNVKIRDLWVSLFEDAGVHLAFEHHDHSYKRTAPLLDGQIDSEGIVFLGDGAWGVATRAPRAAEGDPHLQTSEEIHHAFLVTLSETGRLVQAINVHGEIFDQAWLGTDGIPLPPDGLMVDRVTSGSASFSWSPAVRAIRYQIERDGVGIGSTTQTQFVDSDRDPQTTASYRVIAENRSGESPASTELVIPTPPLPAIPAVPSGVQAQALGPHTVQVTWPEVTGAYTYRVLRDDVVVAEELEDAAFADSGLFADTVYLYQVQAANVTGISAPSTAVSVQTAAAVAPFSLDGVPESAGYLLAAPDMRIYAAIRGTELYIATWSPAQDVNDHFIFISDHVLPSATVRAPWDKKGFVAHPLGAPFLAAESDADYIEWNHAPSGSGAFRSLAGDGKMEGTIDLIQAFGAVPDRLHLAAVAYGTANYESLRTQAPLGNGDEHLDPDEFLVVPVDAIRDSLGIGVYDRLDPERALAIDAPPMTTLEPFTVRWRAVPGRQYRIWRSVDIDLDIWTIITPIPITAPSGADVMSYTDYDSASFQRAYYLIEAY